MEIISKLIGFILFIAAAVGLYFLLKGKGRVLTMGSWQDLERNFGVATIPATHINTSAMIGAGRYRDSFKVALTETGVYMDTPALLKLGGKPLFIPYPEFTLPDTNRTVSFGFFTYTQFLVRGQSVCLTPDVANKIIDRKNQLNVQSPPPTP